jgi:hypothetical protein
MAIAYVNSTISTSTSAPVTLNVPSGGADGNLLVAICVNSNSSRQFDDTAGWTTYVREADSTANRKINIFWRIASSEPASYSFSGPADVAGCVMLRISGAVSTTPLYDYGAGAQANSMAPSIAACNVDPTTASSLLIGIPTCNATGTTTSLDSLACATSNPSWTRHQQFINNTYGMMAVYTAVRTETTNTGAMSWADTDGSTSTDNLGMIIAVKPAAAGPENLKSYNTNLKANIKSINTNLIANVKTLDTNA